MEQNQLLKIPEMKVSSKQVGSSKISNSIQIDSVSEDKLIYSILIVKDGTTIKEAYGGVYAYDLGQTLQKFNFNSEILLSSADRTKKLAPSQGKSLIDFGECIGLGSWSLTIS